MHQSWATRLKRDAVNKQPCQSARDGSETARNTQARTRASGSVDQYYNNNNNTDDDDALSCGKRCFHHAVKKRHKMMTAKGTILLAKPMATT